MKFALKYGWILLSFLLISCEENPVNWQKTFDSEDSIPYGTYVLRKELPRLFPDSDIVDVRNYTEELEYYANFDDLYIYIMDSDRKTAGDWNAILEHVESGGQAFISLSDENKLLEEAFRFKTAVLENNKKAKGISVDDTLYEPFREMKSYYFSVYDERNSTVLGNLELTNTTYPNFIKVEYGEGIIFLHTEPFIFTNYNLLRSNYSDYVATVFSFMDSEVILWDNHRMYSRRAMNESRDGGFFESLSFILKNQGLRQAFFLLLAMGILFLIFNSRRKQKAVPIILPYSNYALDFAKTLSNLYQSHPDHTAMVRYKINYFLEQIRIHYHIQAKDTENDFSELLSTKSGVDKSLCEKLVLTLELFRERSYLDQQDFFRIQSQIEQFSYKSGNYGRKRKR